MENVCNENGKEFAKAIEEDEDVPLENICLFNGTRVIYKGSIGDFNWICINRIKGG